jgi:hypothetical protein
MGFEEFYGNPAVSDAEVVIVLEGSGAVLKEVPVSVVLVAARCAFDSGACTCAGACETPVCAPWAARAT